MDDMKPHLADIYQAGHLIRETIYRTPLIESPWLSELSGCRVFLKLENLQVTGSFKIRGETIKLLSLKKEENKRGVIAVSSGNHGRTVTYMASRLWFGSGFLLTFYLKRYNI
jgi:threonine dehydratase